MARLPPRPPLGTVDGTRRRHCRRLVWAVWHVPFFYVPSETIYYHNPFLGFTVSITLLSVLMTWGVQQHEAFFRPSSSTPRSTGRRHCFRSSTPTSRASRWSSSSRWPPSSSLTGACGGSFANRAGSFGRPRRSSIEPRTPLLQRRCSHCRCPVNNPFPTNHMFNNSHVVADSASDSTQ